jgi:hypothetical protein
LWRNFFGKRGAGDSLGTILNPILVCFVFDG